LEKKWNNDKLVVVTLFTIITIEKKKCNDNKLVAVVFFTLSKKKEKLGNDSKLVVVASFVAKNRRKKKAMTRLCHLLLHFKHKQKNERRKEGEKNTNTKKTIKKKCREKKELTFFLPLLSLGWSTPLPFPSPCSFNVELSTFFKLCVSCLLKALSYSSSGALPTCGNGVNMKWGEGGR